MVENIELGDVVIALQRKSVKHVHLTVHPPTGRVTLVAPLDTRVEVARAYAISKLRWIREQQVQLGQQAREVPRQFVERESHYVWGRRYLLAIAESDERPSVKLSHRRLCIHLRPNSPVEKRAEVMYEWQRAELHKAIPVLIERWERRLGVRVEAYFLQRMKTKWGSCNSDRRHIRINTELIKKPPDLLEYVVVHEMLHLREPNHSDRFQRLLNRHWPQWRESRLELNRLPLGSGALSL
jgi:predicted metal-dependent hydrolase